MKCHGCKKNLSTQEFQKAVCVYVYADGHEEVTNPSEGDKATPGGKIKEVWHYKHYKVRQKLERRTADPGSMVGRQPTAYEIDAYVMNADEAADGYKSGDTTEFTVRNRKHLEEKQAERQRLREEAALKNQASVLQAKEDDVEDTERDKDLKWPAGGQVDVEI